MNSKKSHRLKTKEQYRTRTHLIHGNFDSKKWDYDHHVVPPMSSSATYRLSSTQRGAQGFFEFASESTDFVKHVPIYIYDRLEEPTRCMLEENLAYAEGGEMCVTFASGMAAISANICFLCEAGHELVAHNMLYGCSYSLITNWLPRFGIKTHLVDLRDLDALHAAISSRTRIIYLESPVNPNMTLIDIAAIRRVADEFNRDRAEGQQIRIIVDNTFATPYCQQPISLGADFSVHSLTKGIGGFGTDMGGAIIGSQKDYSRLMLFRKDFGGVLSPKVAWIFLVYGLPTLSTRMINQQKTAQKIASFLSEHPKIEKVLYPGLESHPQFALAKRQMINYEGKFSPGSLIYFTLKGAETDTLQGERFIDYIADHAYCITLAVSLGQIKTLIENPYSMTHSMLPGEEKKRLGVEPGGIRLSVGLEDWHDIIEDLQLGLDRV